MPIREYGSGKVPQNTQANLAPEIIGKRKISLPLQTKTQSHEENVISIIGSIHHHICICTGRTSGNQGKHLPLWQQ